MFFQQNRAFALFRTTSKIKAKMDAKMGPKIDDKAEICHQMVTKSPKTVTEIRRMEPKAVKWKLEGAKRASEGGKSATGSWYPVPVRLVSGDLCAKSPDPRGDPSLKYFLYLFLF